MSKHLNTAIDVKPKGVGKNPAADTLEEQYKRTNGYLNKYPNGRVNLKGHKDVIKLRFETFRQTGVQPSLNYKLLDNIFIGEDERFFLIGRRDAFDQVQYVNPGGRERDGHCGISAIHVMAIPRKNGNSKQEVMFNGVALHKQNLDIIKHMKRKFMEWWEEGQVVRNGIIWHQAKTILSTYHNHLSDIALGKSKRQTDQKVTKGEAGQLANRFLALRKDTGISETELRREDLPRWHKLLVKVVEDVENDAKLDLKKKPWTHPANRLLVAKEHYMELEGWARKRQIRAEDFDYALHLPPDNTIDYLHLHIFLAPKRFRQWSVAIWDWSYKSADEVVEVAGEYEPIPAKANQAASSDARKQVQTSTAKAAVQPQRQQSANTQQQKVVAKPQAAPSTATRNVAGASTAQQKNGPSKTRT